MVTAVHRDMAVKIKVCVCSSLGRLFYTECGICFSKECVGCSERCTMQQ